MPIPLNCASPVICITTKSASLHFIVREHGSLVSKWFLTTAQTTNRAPSCSGTTDTEKALGGTLDHRYQHDLKVVVQATQITMDLAAAKPKDFNMVSGGSTDHGDHIALGDNTVHRHQ